MTAPRLAMRGGRVGVAEVNGTMVSVPVNLGGDEGRLTYQLPDTSFSSRADAFLAATLVPALRVGQPLHVAGTVSPRLQAAIPQIQDIWLSWDPTLRRIPVDAGAWAAGEPIGTRVGCLFTAGVDSFYSTVKHRDEIDELIYIHGFDVAPERVALRERVQDGVRAAARELGKPLIEVETNIRWWATKYWGWNDYHGSAIASVLLLLAPRFRKVFVPATHTYANLRPLGSHPLLDPLWSTEQVEIVHDGLEANRLDKIERILAEPAARHWLRVCATNTDDSYNCGHCEKCLRTMIALRVNAAQDTSTFPPLNLRSVWTSQVPDNIYTWQELLRRAREVGDDELARVLHRRLATQRLHKMVWPTVTKVYAKTRRFRPSGGSSRR